jgi:hypothetical protein
MCSSYTICKIFFELNRKTGDSCMFYLNTRCPTQLDSGLRLMPNRPRALSIRQTKLSPATDSIGPRISIWPALEFPVFHECVESIFLEGHRILFATWEKCVAWGTLKYVCIARERGSRPRVNFYPDSWVASLQRVHLGTEYCLLCEVSEQVTVLPDFSTQVANCCLKSPLCITSQRTGSQSLWSNVCEQVNAVPNKMYSGLHTPIV